MEPTTPPSDPAALAPFVPSDEAVSLAIRQLRDRHGLASMLASLRTHFGYDEVQGTLTVREATLALQRVMDDEGVIEATMADSLGKLLQTQATLFEHAQAPIPDRVLDVLGPDPDDPEAGAIYRKPTLAEQAQAVQTRIAAAKALSSVTEAAVKIVSRRSKRWAEKPTTIIVGDTSDLTEEDREYMKRLGMIE